jgi:Ni/Fe-hydrogenase subunit HybB-like protein
VHLRAFLMSALRSVTSGHPGYHLWMGSLTALMLVGGYAYFIQANEGLVVTGMNDHVSWGLYISNMAFLVGVAAAAVILVLPAYVLHDIDFSRAVLIAEGVAVAALVMCLGFVMANSPGYPWKWWRLTPVIGILNWPDSMLAWDVIMLNGYLVLNLVIPFYILYQHFIGREPSKKKYVPFIYI